jgi:excisionase family DNA binding protein
MRLRHFAEMQTATPKFAITTATEDHAQKDPVFCRALPAWVHEEAGPTRSGDTLAAPASPSEHLLTLTEVAQYLRISTRTVSRLIASGSLPALRLGRAVRIRHADLLDMLDRKLCISADVGVCRE